MIFQTAIPDGRRRQHFSRLSFKLYFIRLHVQTAKGQKIYLKSSPSGNFKTASSYIWYAFLPDG